MKNFKIHLNGHPTALIHDADIVEKLSSTSIIIDEKIIVDFEVEILSIWGETPVEEIELEGEKEYKEKKGRK